MLSMRWVFAVCGFLVLANIADASESGAPDPLFENASTLDVRIAAPLRTLTTERPLEEELPASFEYTSELGETIAVDVQIRTRGRFRHRRETCRFPPMRLNFRKSAVADTLLHKQDKLKLVTHCQSAGRFEQVLLREFIAYRLLNVLTEQSFKVRLLRITWVDQERGDKELIKYGFLIEHRDRLAKRIGLPVVDVAATSVDRLMPAHTNLMSVYHFMIGNTDFSPIRGADDDCCHNHELFGEKDAKWVSIPYDFDMSGLVNAPYAAPNERFKLRNVRQRLYRGRCAFAPELQNTIAHFQANRELLYETADSVTEAQPKTRRYVNSYLDEFFEVLDSERRLNNQLVKACI